MNYLGLAVVVLHCVVCTWVRYQCCTDYCVCVCVTKLAKLSCDVCINNTTTITA